MLRATAIALGLLLFIPGDEVRKVGDRVQVTVFQTGLKPSKSRLAKDIGTLKEGDLVLVESVDPYWLGVRAQDLSGFVLLSSVATQGKTKLSSQTEASTVSVEDRTAAQRGFNPQVEKEYRRQHQSLEQAFALVDRIEARLVDLEALERFRSEGLLGGGDQ